jgi:hypothetical protein
MPYPIPTDHERRALFAWLKQASSLSAWRRLYSHHQVFVDAVANAYVDEQSTPGMKLTIATERYTSVLQSHDAFYAALERLARGDRRCFTYLGAPGHFSQGIFNVEWWQDMYSGSYSGRNGWAPADSPHWPEIEKAMHDCLAALSDIGVVLQDRVIDDPASVSAIDDYQSDPTSSIIKQLLGQSALPAVSTAVIPEVLVATGKGIPCYGIWEPVRMGRTSGTGRTPKGLKYSLTDSREVDGHTLDGCMNYLCGDFEAPTIAFQEDSPRHDGRPTTWRLVWRDDRYGENPMPEEENQYVFVQPVPGEVLFTYG